jgi:hypothetical protein
MTTDSSSNPPNEPNDEGFAGDPSTPEPEPAAARRSRDEVDGESVAVPAGDITGAITGALENATADRDEDS